MGPNDNGLERQRERLRARAVDAIWAGTPWLSASDIAARAPVDSPVTREVLARWETEGRLFGLEKAGEKVYPSYAFGSDFRPLAALKSVLEVLRPATPLLAACFFESTSSFLAGQRPRDLLASEPERVIAQVLDDLDWEEFGG